MKVLIGLGNPGSSYSSTRHNAGFMVVDRLATESGAHFDAARNLFSQIAKVRLRGMDVLLVKPVTYMNSSGKAFVAVSHWYKVPLAHCLVIHDDVSLPLGRLRLQKGGGAGGQHGIESIIEHLGGKRDFDRLKLGVGPDPGGDKRANYVLSCIPDCDKKAFSEAITTSAEAALCWLENGIDFASNTFNGVMFGEPLATKEERQTAEPEGKAAKQPEQI